MSHAPHCCDHSTHPATTAAAPLATAPAAGQVRSVLHIAQMDCPTEERLLRDALGPRADVSALSFNLMQRRLTVDHSPGALPALVEAVAALGMQALTEGSDAAPTASGPDRTRMVLAGVAALASELTHLWLASDWPSLALALLSLVLVGPTVFKKGWIAIRHGQLNINALMSIAVTGALLIGQWPEAAMVMFLFALAEAIEARSLDRARDAVTSLMAMAPEQVQVADGQGDWRSVAAAQVPVGSLVRLAPGERVALDGEVVLGQSSLNQAPITGESVPVEKSPGSPLYAGSLNLQGELTYRTTAAANDSTLARIIHRVEEAQASQAPTQRFIDRFARWYTPAAVLVAVLMAVVPPLLLGTPWLEALYNALVILVIACPCALVISTPVAVVSALTRAARSGILIKGGVYLEQGRQLQVLALDKTGTLTEGKPTLQQVLVVAGEQPQAERAALSLAARSDHPVSRALAEGLATRQQAAPMEQFEALLGRGSRGLLDGRPLWLGNARLMRELGVSLASIDAQRQALEATGQTVVMLADADQVLALFAVADRLRPDTVAALTDLHRLGVRTVMLSGDNQAVADHIAAQAGIDEARGELLPEDKLDAVRALQQQAVVGMVGDGINDAPALAQAEIGFAMGAVGTDTAIDTADVALMDDDLRKIPAFIRLSQATRRVLLQNISVALGLKVVFLALALGGLATMWMAVVADVGASLLVVFNSLRLLRARQ
ncbi:heavy metal translocating P-type ATPase [Isoalcanivorax beigongshangi]|uniref:P-type Zn(2+) transporter n=1 Tax=Isoalcanivorax beigongshangi TaxID=3238810 RepID=A0ABV4ADT7_9GAMM